MCRFDEDESGFLDTEELKKMAKKLWLPDAPTCVSPSDLRGSRGSLSRSPSPTTANGAEPDAVKLLLQLAADKDDGDGEISWEEFLDLMQSLYHAPSSPTGSPVTHLEQ